MAGGIGTAADQGPEIEEGLAEQPPPFRGNHGVHHDLCFRATERPAGHRSDRTRPVLVSTTPMSASKAKTITARAV
jgi:hypothetical protein